MRLSLVLVLVASGCLKVQDISDVPTLPATPPVRMAIGPMTISWSTDDGKPQPDLRADIAGWLNGWHGVTVASMPGIEAFDAGDLKPHHPDRGVAAKLCAAAKAAGFDAVLLGEISYSEGERSPCTRTDKTWSTNPDGESKCVAWSEKTRPAQALMVEYRVLTTAPCGVSGVFHVNYFDKGFRWLDVRHFTRRAVPDKLRTPAETPLTPP